MNEKYEIGDFGRAKFNQTKKGFETRIDCFGTIKAVEKKVVLFTDNDGFNYLIYKKDFEFEKCDFKIK